MPDEETLVTVIIPVYNSAPYLRRCLDSVIGQSWKKLEIICVDDGSADESPDIIKEYEKLDGRIKCVFRKENGGQSAARNAGLDMANGEWITFVDSDDEVTVDMVERLLCTAVQEGVQLVKGGMIVLRTYLGIEERTSNIPGVRKGEELIMFILKTDHYRVPFPCIMHKDLISKRRFPEGRIYEDTYFFMELIVNTNGCAFIEDMIYIYYMRANGTVKGSPIEKKMDRIWVAHEITRIVTEAVPTFEGCANAYELELICPIFYAIDRAGRKKYPQQWKYTVDAINELRHKPMEKQRYHRIILFLFSISPVLLAKTRRFYMWSVNLVRKIKTRIFRKGKE